MHNGSQAISEQTITESVLSSISNIIKSGNVLFSYSTHNDSPNATTYANQLKKLAAKEKRIKAAYIDGIDSLEEYKENKKKVLLEKEAVQKKLDRCQKPRTVAKDEMLERMRTVYDILSNDEIPYEKKSTAVRSIIDKIVYNRDTNECMITYYFS